MKFFLLCLILFYIIDIVFCTIYCKKKKKIDLIKWEGKKSSHIDVVINDKEECSSSGILWKIKQILNGWIFYRVKRLAKVPSQKYRKFILKYVFQMDIAEKVVIYSWNTIRAPWNISIGKGTVIGHDISLDGRNFITIGENVNISTGVSIYTEQHDINDSFFRSLNSGGTVIIGNRSWISSHTVVLPKVHVGEGAVLASGALAVRALEPYGIYVGIPARKVGTRSKNLKYEFNGEYLPFI